MTHATRPTVPPHALLKAARHRRPADDQRARQGLGLHPHPGRSKIVGAVTGGTGAYANARGVVVSQRTKSGAVDTITLVS
jgi:hypothetical protein